MNYFYFDTGIHRFLTKEHTTKNKQNQIDNLLSNLIATSGVDLYVGFKQVWGPGLYLEQVNLGTKLLTNIVEKIEPIDLSELPSDKQINSWFTQTQKHIEKVVMEILREHLLLPPLPLHIISDAQADIANDLNDRYNDEEKKLLVQMCLVAEAMQQALLEKLKGKSDIKKTIQIQLFHSCIKGFFYEFFKVQRDINLSRMMLMYSSISKGIDKNAKKSDKNRKKRLIDPNKDIADCELIHFATFGTWVNKELKPVSAVTLDSPDEIRARLTTVKSISVWAMANLYCDMQLQFGTVFCIDISSCNITSINVKELDIEPWVNRS